MRWRAAHATHARHRLAHGPGALLPQFRPLADVSFYWDAIAKGPGSVAIAPPLAPPRLPPQTRRLRPGRVVLPPFRSTSTGRCTNATKRSVLSGIGGVDYYVDFQRRAKPRIVSRAALDRLLGRRRAASRSAANPTSARGMGWSAPQRGCGPARLRCQLGLGLRDRGSGRTASSLASKASRITSTFPFHVIMWAAGRGDPRPSGRA